MPQALVALGDAELALGNVDAAEAAYDDLAVRAPGPDPLSRQAAVHEARGAWQLALSLAAEAAMAAEANGLTGEGRAWYDLQVAEIALEYGRFDHAEQAYLASLGAFPGYGHALAGLGKLAAARGDLDQTIESLSVVTERAPDPATLALLGDLYAARGDLADSERQFETVELLGQLDESGQGIYRHELAIFYADHGLHRERAVELALADLRVRQGADAQDAAAWALYEAGRLDQARELSDQALATRTQAPAVLYHAGMIAKAQGRLKDARELLSTALAINAAFDVLQAPRAAAALAELGAGSAD